jgi:hypothetical protein
MRRSCSLLFWRTTWLVNSGQHGLNTTERFLAGFTAVLPTVCRGGNQVLSAIFGHDGISLTCGLGVT